MKNDVKRRAKQMVSEALRRGTLIRASTCEKCGRSGGRTLGGAQIIQGHHPDYSRPLLVEWLCIQCHRDVTPKPAFKGQRQYGVESFHAKLSEAQVREIFVSPMSQRKLAKLHGVNPTTIRRVKSRQQWRRVTDDLATMRSMQNG